MQHDGALGAGRSPQQAHTVLEATPVLGVSPRDAALHHLLLLEGKGEAMNMNRWGAGLREGLSNLKPHMDSRVSDLAGEMVWLFRPIEGQEWWPGQSLCDFSRIKGIFTFMPKPVGFDFIQCLT